MDHPLRPFRGIAWDFDGTLIDHPACETLHAIILAHPDKRHVIVTFRTQKMLQNIARDLSAYPHAPPLSAFTEVRGISERRWEMFEWARMQRLSGVLQGPPTHDEEYYVEWKGAMCRQLGLRVLVDDNTAHAQPGCLRHGITLLHPDQFI